MKEFDYLKWREETMKEEDKEKWVGDWVPNDYILKEPSVDHNKTR